MKLMNAIWYGCRMQLVMGAKIARVDVRELLMDHHPQVGVQC